MDPSQADTDLAKRPARVLIGWLEADEAGRWLVGQQSDVRPSATQVEQAALARAAVATRAPGVEQSEVVTALPEALAGYVKKLEQTRDFADMLREGFRPAMADLTKLCALQPYVYTDHRMERVAMLDAGDLAAIAEMTLPMPTLAPPPSIHFDEATQSWVLPAANPNLRIIGPFNAALEPSGHAFGFIVGVTTSFLQVSAFNGRYFLRDGYHRAYGLLARGIKQVPVMLRDCATSEEFCPPPGMLPPEVCLGERPPRLPDYLDKRVSMAIEMSGSRKLVVIQGSERNFIPQ